MATTSKFNWWTLLRPWIIALAWVYFTVLFAWLTAYLIFGDKFGYLAIINQLAVYFFIPLPAMFMISLSARRSYLWLGTASAFLVFLWFWGPLFLTQITPRNESKRSLRVMTYNALVWNFIPEVVIDVVIEEDPDVVFFQEVNHPLAVALETELKEEYPYQEIKPFTAINGLGVISKYPLRLSEKEIQIEWEKSPLILEMDWNGQELILVNFHLFPFQLGNMDGLDENFRMRERQAQGLVEFAEEIDMPLIAAGDANSGSLSTVYKIMTSELNDAWAEAGFGLGHTFPGSDIPGSARPRLGRLSVPQWMVRIDYIFNSHDWLAQDAWLAAFDGYSDHRGVVVELRLVE